MKTVITLILAGIQVILLILLKREDPTLNPKGKTKRKK